MAGALFVNAARESVLSFSRPYVRNGLVIVTRQDPAAPADADHLDGRTIAMVRNSAAIPLLQQRYPQAKVVTADNPTEAMLLVADGQADAVVQTQISASYYVNRYFAGKLRIASALDLPPAEIALATARGQTELISILNKALYSISNDELASIVSRWRGSDGDPRTWYAYRNEIYLLIGLGLLSALLFLSWIVYLRRQIRQRKRAERALNDQLEFMRVLIDGTPNPIYVRDKEGRMLLCNDAYLDTFGVTADAVLGKTIPEANVVGDPALAREMHEFLLTRMAAEREPRFEDRDVTLHGRTRHVYQWTVPYGDSLGELKGHHRRLDRHYRTRRAAARAARRQGKRRRRQPGQDHVPGNDEPRDPHADERDHRHAGAGAAPSGRPGAGPPVHPGRVRLGPQPAGADRRHPGHCEDRGGKIRPGAGAHGAARPARRGDPASSTGWRARKA